MKGSALSQRAPHGTIVTLLELPYEKPVYEGPLYPGTLTYQGTVPTIKLFRQMSGRWSANAAGDTGRTIPVIRILL